VSRKGPRERKRTGWGEGREKRSLTPTIRGKGVIVMVSSWCGGEREGIECI
jgi:hypothetical protein